MKLKRLTQTRRLEKTGVQHLKKVKNLEGSCR